ncbi:MAG: hypothetical protein E7Z88_04760 [Cyanobacteria bacterium SIG27]|nr:hypothetical protein [Cyanobacteria bacterium SIG27]
MSFEDFQEIQEQLERAQKEQEQKEKLQKEEQIDDFGFSEVLEERQKHKDALRERLEKQNFSKKEIEKLFDIISKAEIEMEEVKAKFDYKAKVPGSGVKLQQDLIDIQKKMKLEFDIEFYKILLKKYKK